MLLHGSLSKNLGHTVRKNSSTCKRLAASRVRASLGGLVGRFPGKAHEVRDRRLRRPSAGRRSVCILARHAAHFACVWPGGHTRCARTSQHRRTCACTGARCGVTPARGLSSIQESSCQRESNPSDFKPSNARAVAVSIARFRCGYGRQVSFQAVNPSCGPSSNSAALLSTWCRRAKVVWTARTTSSRHALVATTRGTKGGYLRRHRPTAKR